MENSLKSYVWVSEVCDLLNGLLKRDCALVRDLIEYRVPCNQEVVDHPTVQVRHDYKVGLLGILNGLFDTREDGSGQISCGLDENGQIIGFWPSRQVGELGIKEGGETVPKK